ncbi:MAG: glycerophosphodiester phosphodiesterase [Propionicimonas sp.]
MIIWAHRGARRQAPENTLPAFRRAIELGAEGVEFDVQLSADGVSVVIHDETLDRTTDGHGRVVDHTLGELRALDASAGKPGFPGVVIPTLDEVLAVFAPTELAVNIELKNSVVEYPGLEEAVLAAVSKHGLERRVVLSSFNADSVARLQDLTSIPRAFVYDRLLRRPWAVAARLGAVAVHPPSRFVVSPRYVTRAHQAGLAVRVWTVNSERELRRMYHCGVDGVFSDVPDVALAVRARLDGSLT